MHTPNNLALKLLSTLYCSLLIVIANSYPVVAQYSPHPTLRRATGCGHTTGGVRAVKCESIRESTLESSEPYQNGERLFFERNFVEAVAAFEQEVYLARETKDELRLAQALNALGISYSNLQEYSDALLSLESALLLFEQLQDDEGIGNVSNNLGEVHLALGLFKEASLYFQNAIKIRRSQEDIAAISESLHGLAISYEKRGEIQQAIYAYEAAVKALISLEDWSAMALIFANLSFVYDAIGDADMATNLAEKALDFSVQSQDPSSEAYALNTLGWTYFQSEKLEQAVELHLKALQIANNFGFKGARYGALRGLGLIYHAADQPELSIILLKESISIVDEARKNIQALGADTEFAYTEEFAEDYRFLADLLLQENRIIEAQRVLDLLKVQELDDYIRGVERTSETETGVEFLRPEETILARYDALQQSAIAAGQELDALKDTPPAQRTEEQAQRIAQLTDLLRDINGDFRDFARSPEIRELIDQLSFEARDASLNLNQLDRLRDELQQLNAAIFYPLILEDRLELVITVPDSPPLRRTVDVSRDELNAAILDFRMALTDPGADAETPAQQLYDWLIRPLEDDLAAAGVETLIYSPDGQLRYIPLAALHDGDNWLIQQYRINNITAESLTDLTESNTSQPKILAAAYADESLVHTPEVNGTPYTFRGLPGAGLEVSGLPTETKFFDEAFSFAAVSPIMDDYNILHFATHAAFVPGVPEDSFILFGNGETPTLRDVEDWSLNGVDLVVLSACETGVGGLGNGEEILGLGYQFQVSGAKAVVSSLWKVSDNGTQALMSAFYTAMDNGFSKAEALKRAQQAMIADDLSLVGGEGRVRAGAPPMSRDGRSVSPDLPGYSHPYYWAPFILIGNGL